MTNQINISRESIKLDTYNGQTNAFFKSPREQETHNIVGSPMGRGATKEKAIDDLIYRVSCESHIDINITD